MKTKAEAVDEIGRLLTGLADSDDGADRERDYMVAASPPPLAPLIRELPTIAMHLLAGIGDGATNIVGLSALSGHPKGTVSKHVQRLVEAGLVQRSPVPGNRKEIHLSLTADGVELDRVHRRMHEERFEALRNFLLRYTSAELQTLAKILGDLLASGTPVVGSLTRTGR
ncbi:MarR family transcriptional regulator [Mycolicibacterium sp. BiH015]|uniref:MarR family winged helix-turn-helix transcriptional regulator n=1 Tax=Mycolicibacterium sp. BiH015 TaxID=3018808 RepID=UPI0022E381A1|nr:MarR family transcriptional regulator [Mycolicibacterium sp. BiH015]MDA2894815.1 MarR family transcriptional regulator [Mycolicibacterium sp. BiH015]